MVPSAKLAQSLVVAKKFRGPLEMSVLVSLFEPPVLSGHTGVVVHAGVVVHVVVVVALAQSDANVGVTTSNKDTIAILTAGYMPYSMFYCC